MKHNYISRRISTFTFALAVAGTSCSSEGGGGGDLRSHRQPVVFGTASQHDYSEEEDPAMRMRARAMGVIYNRSAVNWCAGNSCELKTETVNLCSGQLYTGEDSLEGGHCSATWIGGKYFATAGHCLVDDGPEDDISVPEKTENCSNLSVAMRWRRNVATPTSEANPAQRSDLHIYDCARVVAHGGHPIVGLGSELTKVHARYDWAIIEVDREVDDQSEDGSEIARLPVPVAQSAPLATEALQNMAFPLGLALKIESDASLRANHLDWLEWEGDETRGSSGSPVMTLQTGVIVGIQSGLPTTHPFDPDPNYDEEIDFDESDTGPCIEHTVCNAGEGSLRCRGNNAAAAFSNLKDAVVDAIPVAVAEAARLDGDELPDQLVATTVDGTFHLDAALGTGEYVVGPLVPGLTLAPQMVGGNFTATGPQQVAVLVNGTILLAKMTGSVGSYAISWTALSGTYQHIEEVNSNSDDFTDLRVTLADGSTQILTGSPGELVPSDPVVSFPSPSPSDGRLLTMTGQGLSTVASPHVSLKLTSDLPALELSIYDGDLGGVQDQGLEGLDACYRLWTDPCGDGLGSCGTGDSKRPRLVAGQLATLGSKMGDDVWTTIFDGDHAAHAEAPSGRHVYRLESFLVPEGDESLCDSELNAIAAASKVEAPGISGFMVRANALSSINFGEFTMIGWDLNSEFAPDTSRPWMRDTDFDGSFTFWFDVSDAGEGINLKEADADHLLDPNNPGQAVGANDSIQHYLENPVGQRVTLLEVLGDDETVLLPGPLVTNPSGNFDAAGSDDDLERYRVQAADMMPGVWRWQWDNVWPQNNIHLWAVEASPVTYEMTSVPARRRSISSALSSQDWLDGAATGPFLPIVLGLATTQGELQGESRIVLTGGEVHEVLSVTGGTPREELERALLTVKLNISRALARDELLESALLYGGLKSVRTLTTSADAILRGPFDIVAPSIIEQLIVELEAVSKGQVTYFRPGVPIPAHPADDGDGDGIINVRDNCPTIANPNQEDSVGDGVGDACGISPIVECVRMLPSGNMEAYFGYDNPLAFRSVPAGSRNSIDGSYYQGQPTEFVLGRQHNVFSVSLGAHESTTWTLEGTTITADADSRRCTGRELFGLPGGLTGPIFGTDGVTMQNGANVSSGSGGSPIVYSNGRVALASGAESGDVFAGADVVVSSLSEVRGFVVAGGVIEAQAGALISSGEFPGAFVEHHSLDWWVDFPESSGQSIHLEPWSPPQTASPGAYREIVVKSGANLTLGPGSYYLDTLQIEPGAKLLIDNSQGAVIVHVSSSVSFKGTVVEESGLAPDLLLAYLGASSVAFLETGFHGDIIAPHGTIVLGNQGEHVGRFFAKQVELRANATVRYQLPGSEE